MLFSEDLRLKTQSGELLQEFSYSLHKSQVLCVMGPNGSGKSTFLKHIFTSYKKINPSIRVSYLPQSHNKEFFIPHTLFEVSSISSASGTLPELFLPYLPKNFFTRLWNNASGGERQRALLLQVLSQPSDLYLLDEPFNHLDENSVMEFSMLINVLAEAHGKSFVLVTHKVPQSLNTQLIKNVNFVHLNQELPAHV